MKQRHQITPEIMLKAYSLHEHNLNNNYIADVLGVSPHSVLRVCQIMDFAKNGDIQAVMNYGGKGMYIAQKQFAMKHFGLFGKVFSPEQEQAAKPNPVDNTAIIMQKVIDRLDYMVAILSKIGVELGIEGGQRNERDRNE